MLARGAPVADYVVDELLGRGGYAEVYRAHTESGSAVALKLLDAHHRGPADLARLQREFRFCDALDHPHVIKVYDRGENWLAMELVDGGSAINLPRMSDRLAALTQVADALDYTHRLGIVHCDVKPANILVRKPYSTVSAVLVDFGIAHSLAQDIGRHTERVEASLPYSAPELLQGRNPTAAVDEYALACAAAELITGATPFRAHTAMGLVDQHLNAPAPRLSRKIAWIPYAFDSILAKALAKDPERRYESCAEMIRLLARTLR
jgi:serine/threonine-protein kinase